MLQKCIEEIKRQGKGYTAHGNQWNVMQQLIDIISFEPSYAGVVYDDLKIKEMDLKTVIGKVTGERLADPRKVMEKICDFYKIPCPKVLPPEVWRGAAPAAPVAKPVASAPAPPKESGGVIDLLDLM